MPKYEKVKERKEFFRIRQSFVQKNGKRDFMALEKYFKEHPDFESVDDDSLRRWETQIYPTYTNGEFDIEGFFRQNQDQLAQALLKAIKDGKVRSMELALKLLDKLTEKREDTVRFEFTAADRIRIARELKEGLRQQFRDTGYCPVCQHPTPILGEVCVDTKQEYGEDGEVGELGLPVEVADGVSTE